MQMNKEKKLKFKGIKLFIIVAIIYLFLAFFYSDKTVIAFTKALSTLITITPIFLLIIFLTALINFFLSPEKLAKHLGQESGFKGYLIALFAGIVSHGPMYAWYPLIEDLKKHRIKSGLIVTFFYARGLKLPMLPIMVAYFGFLYTVVVSLLIIIFSLIQGWIVDKFFKDI
jgi:uncharacterized membrane protein YraQ (UPF0718 family)